MPDAVRLAIRGSEAYVGQSVTAATNQVGLKISPTQLISNYGEHHLQKFIVINVKASSKSFMVEARFSPD